MVVGDWVSGGTPSALSVVGAEVVVVDGAARSAEVVHLVDGRVVAEPGAAAEILDATGGVVTAGLVNAHHHLLQTAFRTLPGTRGVPMARWLPTMAAAYAVETPAPGGRR